MIHAYRGEFGLKIRFHVPVVHRMLRLNADSVQIEEGEEALYPRATAYHVIPRDRPDSQRVGSPGTRGRHEERFTPTPYCGPQLTGLPPDVIVCPRWRSYVESKNWPHWLEFTSRLEAEGLRLFVAGAQDSSLLTLPDRYDASWNYARNVDATIEAMRSCKLVVAACSGLAHLAVLCGAPLLLFSYRGRISPGPVYNSRGKFVSQENKPVPFAHYYQEANHRGSLIEQFDGWEYPDRLASRALALVRG